MDFIPNPSIKPEDTMSTKPVIDTLLEEIVTEWAWESLHSTASRKQRRLLKKARSGKEKIDINIDWSNVRFDNLVQQPSSRHGPDELHQPCTMYQILSESVFTNWTDLPQEFTLKSDEKTKSSATRSIADQVTIGGKLALSLKSPGGIASASGELSKNFMFKKNKGETIEEEKTWILEGKIQVKEKRRVSVQFAVKEVKKTSYFNIQCTVSGFVAVTFKRKKDDSVFSYFKFDIAYILGEYVKSVKRRGQRSIQGAEVQIEDRSAIINAEGSYEVHTTSKEVIMTQESLENNEHLESQHTPRDQEGNQQPDINN